MNQLLIISPIVAACLIASKSFAADWSYDGINGPENWGKIDHTYSLCENGKNQSPIDLSHAKTKNLPRLALNYKPSIAEIINNGNTIKVNVTGNNTLTIEDTVYKLEYFNFHTPSEHTIDKKTFPLEAHFVHKDDEGRIAVVGVIFNSGNYQDPEIQQLIDNMPKQGVKQSLPQSVNLMALLPQSLDYYTYSGSLTTPPCTEGVQWIVLKNKMRLDSVQLASVKEQMGDNNRPIQELNGRVLIG